ncbi:MAG: coenzyme F420-0:L-glutamate ligase [Candidatus Eremiobacteraeota bacterium]|nr:coenzyme F420-0:L-glutamate ligase [Candidatus Eremiobacteraeota bacterium]
MTVLPVTGLPEVRPGDDLVGMLLASGFEFANGDVVVVTQKIVSKAEGRLVRLDSVSPRPEAIEFATRYDKDPRQVELVLAESHEILRMERGIIISRTHQGFVCANAGLDMSNTDGGETACLLPLDCDASARALHQGLTQRLGFELGLIVSDSFGRPWRNGIVNVALGVAGMAACRDYRGQTDPAGLELKASIMASADMLASAAELVMGKTDAVPVAVIRGWGPLGPVGTGAELVRPRHEFLFD